MEEEEYNDIVTYIQDQNYPQNAETFNVYLQVSPQYISEEDNETESEN